MKKFFLSSLIAVLVMFSFSFKVKAIEFKDLAEGFNKSEYSSKLIETENTTLVATYEGEKLLLNYNSPDGKNSIELTYDKEKDAILYTSREYPEENPTEQDFLNIVSDRVSISSFVLYLGNLNGYSDELVVELIEGEEVKNYTLEEDGIELKTQKINVGDGEINLKFIMFTDLKIKLNGGFGHLTKEDDMSANTPVTTTKDEVANPSTSSEGELFLIVFGLISLVTIIVGNNKLSKLKR